MKVSQHDIDNAIFSETYTVLPDGRTTVCQLTLFKEDGFTVNGTSSVVDKSGFNAELGNKFAKEKAVDQVWMLLGFKLFYDKLMNEPALAAPN